MRMRWSHTSMPWALRRSSRHAAIAPEHRAYDRHVYKDRNLVERVFHRLTQFRRMATRDEQLARTFVSLRTLVCAYIWLA
jgi:transposase